MWNPQIISKSIQYDDLTTGKIPALIIPEIISKENCAVLSKKILNTSVNNGTSKFGTSLSSHIYEKPKYFFNAQTSNEFFKKLFLDYMSPLVIMRQKISKLFKKQISTAIENGMSYSDAVIRIHSSNDSVHLHRDNSNFEMNEYNVSHLENQLSAILYLQSPINGGELTIFQKMWNKKDEYMREPEFGYSSELVKNIFKTKILPIEGNMIIFNPKFYHQIESIVGTKSRITLGFFFGEMSKNYLYSWA